MDIDSIGLVVRSGQVDGDWFYHHDPSANLGTPGKALPVWPDRMEKARQREPAGHLDDHDVQPTLRFSADSFPRLAVTS